MKEYLGTLPPGQPNTFLPWVPAPGLLQTGDLCPAASPAPHLAGTLQGQLLAIWRMAASGAASRRAPGEREAGPGSPLEGFCPLQMGVSLGTASGHPEAGVWVL